MSDPRTFKPVGEAARAVLKKAEQQVSEAKGQNEKATEAVEAAAAKKITNREDGESCE